MLGSTQSEQARPHRDGVNEQATVKTSEPHLPPPVELILERSDAVRDEVRQKVQRQSDRLHRTAEEVHVRAERLRTQLAFRQERRHPWRYRLSIASAILLSWIARLLPPFARLGLANGVGWMIYEFNRAYRENLAHNLRRVLGPTATDEDIERTARSAFKVSTKNFVDLILTPRMSPESISRRLRSDETPWERLRNGLAGGNGAIVVSGHVGAFDAVGQVILAHGFPLTVVTGRTTNRLIFDGVSYLRGSQGVTIVEPTPGGVRTVFRKLKNNELVAFVADRDFFQNGRSVVFFGEQTTLPPGPVRIARDTGAPIIPTFAMRRDDGYDLFCGEPITVPKTKDVDADVELGMAQMVAALEQAISQHADQWVMFQRVWP